MAGSRSSEPRASSAFAGHDHRVVGPEQHPRPTPSLHVLHQFGRVAGGCVRARVYVDVRVLVADRDHLGRPRVTDVAADDHELREVESHLVDVGDRPPGLRRPERSCVADLGAKGDTEVHAGRVERVVEPVGGRKPPQPRDDPQRRRIRLSTRLRSSRTASIGLPRSAPARPRSLPGCAATCAATSSFEIRSPLRPVPGRAEPPCDATGVHGRDGELDRDLFFELGQPHPATERIQHVGVREANRGVLDPDVDDARHCCAEQYRLGVTSSSRSQKRRRHLGAGPGAREVP